MSQGPLFTGGDRVAAFRGIYLLVDSLRVACAVAAVVFMVRFTINLARRRFFPMSPAGIVMGGLGCAYVGGTEVARIGHEVTWARLALGVGFVAAAVRYAMFLSRMPRVESSFLRRDPWTGQQGAVQIAVLLAVLLGAALFQAAGTPANAGLPPPWNYVVQWGPLGAGAFALSADVLVPGRRVRKIEADRADWVAYARDIEAKQSDVVIPLLTNVQRDLTEGQKVTADAIKTLTDFRAWLTYDRGRPPGPVG